MTRADVEPHVILVRADRLGIVAPEGAVHGPPDLVAEVLSPSNRDHDRGARRMQYPAWDAGLWLADAGAASDRAPPALW